MPAGTNLDSMTKGKTRQDGPNMLGVYKCEPSLTPLFDSVSAHLKVATLKGWQVACCSVELIFGGVQFRWQ